MATSTDFAKVNLPAFESLCFGIDFLNNISNEMLFVSVQNQNLKRERKQFGKIVVSRIRIRE